MPGQPGGDWRLSQKGRFAAAAFLQKCGRRAGRSADGCREGPKALAIGAPGRLLQAAQGRMRTKGKLEEEKNKNSS